MSVHWPIIRSLVRNATRELVVDDKRGYKGAEILVAALHVAELLEAKCASCTVGLLLPSSGATPICALASWMLGKTVVPLNFLLKRDELQYVIDDCETDTILTVQPMLDFLGYQPRVKNLFKLEDVNFKAVPQPRWPATASDDDLALLLYTSGTSGLPKGVMLTHGNLRSNIEQVQEWIHFTTDEVMFGVLPQFHSFGMTVLTLLPLSVGLKVIYTARFVPHRIVRAIREQRPTIAVFIPSMYNALLGVKDARPEDFASLKFIVSGGEPLPEAVFRGFKDRFGVTINEGYGLTETAPATNWCRPSEWRPHSVGKPLPWLDQIIVDVNTERVLGPNEDGEVRMKGPNIMKGYLKLPKETAAAFDARGYFRTGDLGRFDDEGHLYITGRLKEMMIIGGENVFPREIEEVLNKHPSVAASGVVGVMDPLRGEQPWAFVELREGQSFDEQALFDACRASLAGYKVPREIRRVDALPRNGTGKIMRRELKKLVN
ncbi:MAG: AMP-binding protein [Planctomycetota bacterium]|nr:AMP-binding protein [Planctomycetota bacterium]